MFPDMVACPAVSVSTVQSPVCADGLERTQLVHTCFVRMLASVIVIGRLDTPVLVNSRTPICLPIKFSNEDNVFIYPPFLIAIPRIS